jgi:hypothetical protein
LTKPKSSKANPSKANPSKASPSKANHSLDGAEEHVFFKISPEVAQALRESRPVVALETTIYTHGFPYPENVALALDLEKTVRANGAIPATIGVVGGVARVGLTREEIEMLAEGAGKPETMKVSRRDLPYILGMVCRLPLVFIRCWPLAKIWNYVLTPYSRASLDASSMAARPYPGPCFSLPERELKCSALAGSEVSTVEAKTRWISQPTSPNLAGLVWL